MDWLINIWTSIEPYVMKGIDLLVNSGIGAAIGLLVVKHWEKKHDEKQLTAAISENVSRNVVGKNILVSLESANKDQINNLIAVIKNELKKDFEIVTSTADVVASMAKIMLKFKATTEEEKTELLKGINELEKVKNVELTIIEESKPVVIEVEKIEETEDTQTDISLF